MKNLYKELEEVHQRQEWDKHRGLIFTRVAYGIAIGVLAYKVVIHWHTILAWCIYLGWYGWYGFVFGMFLLVVRDFLR